MISKFIEIERKLLIAKEDGKKVLGRNFLLMGHGVASWGDENYGSRQER
jgi:hypothetical protein